MCIRDRSQAAFLNWNVATVNGGTFDAAGASNGVLLNGYIDGTMDQGKLTINGGTFNAGEKTVDVYKRQMENRDGVGYLPDLWVNPVEAPVAVARLCGYYGLKEPVS